MFQGRMAIGNITGKLVDISEVNIVVPLCETSIASGKHHYKEEAGGL